jgi:Flp pilus assembly pilin Flp
MREVMTRMQSVVRRVARREEGQTSSEYLVIAGVVVLAIIGILGMLSGNLQSAASSIGKNIMDAVK